MSSVKLWCYGDVNLESLCSVIGWCGLTVTIILGVTLTVLIALLDLACSHLSWKFQLFLVAAICQLVSSICLLKSIKTLNRYFLLPWMITTVGNVILLTVTGFASTTGLYVGLVLLPLLILSLPTILLYYEDLMDLHHHITSYDANIPMLDEF